MKRILLLAVLMTVVSWTQAQNYFTPSKTGDLWDTQLIWDFQLWHMGINTTMWAGSGKKEQTPEQKYRVKQTTLDHFKIIRRGVQKPVYKRIDKRNEQGLITETLNKEKNKVFRSTYAYNEKGQPREYYNYDKKGKESSHALIEWQDDKNIREYDKVQGRKLNKHLRYLCEFNAAGKEITKKEFFRDGKKIRKRWEYQYYEDGKRKSTALYNKKNKLVHDWKYDCSVEGKMTGQKDSSRICVKDDKDEKGFRTKTFIYYEKKKILKTICKYDEKDRLREYIRQDKKGRQSARTVNEYTAEGKIAKSSSFGKSNVMARNMYVYEYDANGDISLYKWYKKGKLKYHCVYSYEKPTLVKEVKTLDTRDQQVRSVKKYSYEYF